MQAHTVIIGALNSGAQNTDKVTLNYKMEFKMLIANLEGIFHDHWWMSVPGFRLKDNMSCRSLSITILINTSFLRYTDG